MQGALPGQRKRHVAMKWDLLGSFIEFASVVRACTSVGHEIVEDGVDINRRDFLVVDAISAKNA